MSRKAIVNTKNPYENAFAKRIRDLLGGNNRFGKSITQEEIASVMGVTRQAVGQYYNGATYPTIDKIEKLADYFEVSTDYILGRTDVKSSEMDIRIIAEKTGLSQVSLEHLAKMKKDDHLIQAEDHYQKVSSLKILNTLLEREPIYSLISEIQNYLRHASGVAKYWEVVNSALYEIAEDEGVDSKTYSIKSGQCFITMSDMDNQMVLSKYRCEENLRRVLSDLRYAFDIHPESEGGDSFEIFRKCRAVKNKTPKAGDLDGSDKKEE